MDVLGPVLHIVVRSLVILFPLTVGMLAFRRLALSKSDNAWTYAGICLLCAVATAGVLPWGLGITALNIPLLLLALACPVLWIATLFVFDMSRVTRYGADPLAATARSLAGRAAPKLAPLLLGEADQVTSKAPVFRHRPKPQTTPDPVPVRSVATTTLLSLARDIRNNATSERRRPKLLPPPEDGKLAFVRDRRNA
ncbi:MAG: hypothetical protein AAGK71_10135 [Pseudomonadota bacterium]